jgi:predicted RNase H-like HicB family nuclease
MIEFTNLNRGGTVAQYVALIHKESSSDFGVSFPDFPGCITAGTSIEGARLLAEEALTFHIEGMIEEGGIIPSPSSLDDIMKVREHGDSLDFLIDAQVAEQELQVVDAHDRLEEMAERGRGREAEALALLRR